MLKVLLVFVGGGLGSAARYGVGRLVYPESQDTANFPWGTFIVNVVGCFLIGGLMAYFDTHKHDESQAFFVVGILGGFTTFSSFGFETMKLIRYDHWNLALLNIAGNLVLGLLAVWVSREIVNRFA